jgi:asparagine synthase (glutamine-hydrolysing)
MYLLFAEVRRHVTVALSGEAADEIFGGYPWFMSRAAVETDTFPWLGDAPRLTDCLAPDIRDRLRPADAERDRCRTLLAQVPRLDGETGLQARMREVLFLSQQGPLRYLLDRKDRMSMAVGLEVRVPFCDHRLVEYLWNVPWKMKVGDGREKSVLRAALADLLPAETLYRRKSAYPAAFASACTDRVLDRVRGILGDPNSPLRDMLDQERVTGLIGYDAPTMAYSSTAQMLIPLVQVDAWMREYGVTTVS